MLVKPEWIEVGDTIYFDDRRYFDPIETPKVVIAKIDEEKWSLGDEIDGDKICEMLNSYSMDDSLKLIILQKNLSEINQKYHHIDYGGCGTFSYYVSEILDKHNIKNQIVYLEEKEPPIGAFRCDIKFTHILVKTEYCYIDVRGYYSLMPEPNSWLNNLKFLPKEKLGEMLNESRLWNIFFNEDKRKLLAEDLLKIEIK